MLPEVVGDGVLIAGDAAGMCMNLGFTIRTSQEPSSKRQIFTSWTNPSRASIKPQSMLLFHFYKK